RVQHHERRDDGRRLRGVEPRRRERDVDRPRHLAFRGGAGGRGESSHEHNDGEDNEAHHRRDRAQPDRRSFGSQASRRVSPKRLNPRTARLIARPGNTASHGACSKNARPVVLSMRPHDGSGCWVPTPRKLSEASMRIALPNQIDAMIRMGAVTLGSLWRSSIRRSWYPLAWAASPSHIEMDAPLPVTSTSPPTSCIYSPTPSHPSASTDRYEHD